MSTESKILFNMKHPKISQVFKWKATNLELIQEGILMSEYWDETYFKAQSVEPAF